MSVHEEFKKFTSAVKASGDAIGGGVGNSLGVAVARIGSGNVFDNTSKANVIEDEAAARTEKRFQEQCYLIDNYESFQRQNEKWNYANFTIVNGSPNKIINEITKKNGVENLFKLKPYQLSLLLPKIRLTKLEYPTEGGDPTEIDIVFPGNINEDDINRITESGTGRASGAGLESFEWTLDGVNPAEAKRIISAKLSLFFHNIEDLVREDVVFLSEGTKSGRFSFTDLFSYSRRRATIGKSQIYNTKFFRIKATVGWTVPRDSTLIPQDVLRNLEEMSVTMFLDLVAHDITFNEDGSIRISIDYKASIEGALLSPAADILFLTKKQQDKRFKIETTKADVKKEEAEKKAEGGESGFFSSIESIFDEEPTVEESELAKLQKSDLADRADRYNRILTSLNDSNRIFFIDVPKISLGETKQGQLKRIDAAKLRGSTPPANLPLNTINPENKYNSNDKIQNTIKETFKNEDNKERNETLDTFISETLATKRVDSENLRLNYFFYGDLINVAISILKGESNPKDSLQQKSYKHEFDRIEFLMGPITFYNVRTKSTTQVNIADIPISLNLFQAWWINSVIKVNRDSYPLRSFVADSLASLVVSALGQNCRAQGDRSARAKRISNATFSPSFTVLTVPNRGDSLRIPRASRVNVNDLNSNRNSNFINNGEYKDSKSISQYIFIYAASLADIEMNGNPEEDYPRGIYHINIGSDEGLLKRIKFKKVDQPYKKAANFEREGTLGIGQLVERYNVDMDFFGNTIWNPGSTVYLNPSIAGLGNPAKSGSLAAKLGLGGYYLINRIRNSIDSTGFKTDIEGIWTGPGDVRNEESSATKVDFSVNGIANSVVNKIGLPDVF